MALKVIEDILRREGGYVDHPQDRGGPTNQGITLKTLRLYLGPNATLADLQALTREDAIKIYEKLYVFPFQWIEDERLFELLVDTGVNHGVPTAIRCLQRAIGVEPDGIIGAITKSTTESKLEWGYDLYSWIIKERVRIYGNLIRTDPGQKVFAAGWLRRLAEFC